MKTNKDSNFFQRERFQNVWIRYKLLILASFLALFLAALVAVSIRSQPVYDYKIGLVYQWPYGKALVEQIASSLAEHGVDSNGDGTVRIDICCYQFDIFNSDHISAEIAKIYAEYQKGEIAFYLVEPSIEKYFLDNGEFLPERRSFHAVGLDFSVLCRNDSVQSIQNKANQTLWDSLG